MSRSKRAARGFGASVIQALSQIGVQIVLAPIVLRYAGKEALGAYAAIMQAVGLLTIVDIAGSWSLERFLGKAMGADDGGAQFRTVFTTARTALLITNAIFGLGVAGMSLFVAPLFHLSPAIAAEARHALYVVAVWSILRTPLAAYGNALNATQDLAAANLIGTAIVILRGVASLTFVLLGGGLFGLIIAGTVVEAIASLVYRMRFRSKNPTLMPQWGFPDKALFREILFFGGHVMVINVGNRLYFSSGNMMAALTRGATAASSFYVSQMPAMTGYTTITRISDNSAPAIYELTGRNEKERLARAYLRILRILLFCTVPLGLGVTLFNRDLVTCWVGPSMFGGRLLSVTIGLFCIFDIVRGLSSLFAFAQGWVRLLTGIALFQGIANFGLAFVLGKAFGIGGVTLALCLVLLPSMVILLRRIDHAFSIGIIPHLLRFLARLVVPLAAASLSSWMVHLRVHIAHRHFGGLLLECGVFTAVYFALVYPLSLLHDEKEQVNHYAAAALRFGQKLVGKKALRSV